MSAVSLKDWYYKRILNNVPFLLKHFDEKKGIFTLGDGRDKLYWHSLRPLAFLYKNDLPDNPWFADKSVLDKVLRQGDRICEEGKISGADLGVEWIPFNLLECMDILGNEIGSKRRACWQKAVTGHLEEMKLISNYISTAPNHFIWRMALLYRAGQLFGNDAWMQTAQFAARQVTKMQTVDGYWDEAHRGQGPSPNYHRTHLHGLDLYYRYSGDEEVKNALHKGIDFAIRTAYPDGTPIDAFDGRQPYLAAFAAGMAANALSRTPRGRRLLRRQCEQLDTLGVTDVHSPVGFAVSWYAFATTDFMLDCYRFFEEGPEEPLPSELDGWRDVFVFNGHEGEGGGLVALRGEWFAAVSAAETDVPRFITNVYITERQSGYSLYHKRAGLVAGGGNRMRDHAPFANAIVLTGWDDVDCKFGVFPDELITNHGLPAPEGSTAGFAEWNDPVKSTYHPIRRAARFTDGGMQLTLDFLHAEVRFNFQPTANGAFAITYAFECVDVKKLLLQIPIPLFHPASFRVDKEVYEVTDLKRLRIVEVKKTIRLQGRHAKVKYAVAAKAPYRFTYPLEPMKNWHLKGINYAEDPYFKPLYTVGILSAEFTTPKAEGTLATIEVE